MTASGMVVSRATGAEHARIHIRSQRASADSGGAPALTAPDRPGPHDPVGTDGATPRGSILELEGTVFDGRFRIEERIAEGGFAVVYRACQVALDRRVALKVLKTPRGHDEAARAEFREKFAAEAKTIARLRHPHIVDVYDFSVSTLPSGELAPWMALEWLEGETLEVHLGRRRGAGERGRDPRQAVESPAPRDAGAGACPRGRGSFTATSSPPTSW